jgi:MFS family permease
MIIGGLWALAAGLVWLSFVSPTGNFVLDVLPASLVAALGQALAFIPSLGTAISSAKPEEGGLASGIVNTSYQIGSALGLAAMTAVGVSFGAGRLGDPVALTGGYSAAFLGAAGIAIAGGFLAMATLRTPKGEQVTEPGEVAGGDPAVRR